MVRTFCALVLSCLLVLSLFSAETSAQDRPVLTIYTYAGLNSQWGLLPKVLPGFAEQCQCTPQVVTASDGVALVNRLAREQQQTQADVILGFDNFTADIIVPYVQAHQLKLSDAPQAVSLSPSLTRLTVPFDYGYIAWVVRKPDAATQETRANQPQSLAELAQSSVRVIYPNPRLSTPGYALLVWAEATLGTEQLPQFWKDLHSRTVTVTPTWGDAYTAFINQEADAALSYTTSPAYHARVENDSSYDVLPAPAGRLVQVELMAISKYTQNPELARAFLQFIRAQYVQELIAETQWMYPIAENLNAFPDLPIPNAIHQLPKLSQQDLKRRLKTWARYSQP